MNKIFGTDGIRGKVGKHPITAEFFLKIGWAVGSVLVKKYQNPSIIIGKDTRVSGYLFESALEAGFLSAGVDVGLLGPMPTPAIAYLTRTYGVSCGVVISASHNCFTDNGVKFFANDGFKLSESEQNQIEEKITENIVETGSISVGKARRYKQAIGRYIEFCKSSFNRKLSLNKLKIVIDTANGATYHIAGSVFRELGATVILINDNPNGININHNCGATNTKDLQEQVLKNKADIGIAFDGDGDRVIMVDEKGTQVDGDELLFIIAKYYQSQDKLTNNTIVGTQMTNTGIRHSLKSLGITFIEAKVGDRFVMEQMISHNSILGGEGSGHIICLNSATSGDGIIAALQILEAMVTAQESLLELKNYARKYHQVLKNVKITGAFDLNNDKLKQQQQKIERGLNGDGKVLIRKSGTEPLIRILVEAKDFVFAEKSANLLAECL